MYALVAGHPLLIRVLLLQEGAFWVAQALEYDIAAQGRTEHEARRAFLRTIEAQFSCDAADGRVPLTGIPPAPEWYFDAYRAARALPEVLRPSGITPAYIAQAISDQRVSA